MFDPTLLFFIGLAGFLSYRLFTVLGTRGGHEPEDADRYTPMTPRPAEADNTPRPPEAKADETPAEPWVLTVRENYPGFEPKEFIEGAKSAYEMIVQGYASGELKDIAPYVAKDVLRAFEEAVTARRNAQQRMEVTFVGIESAKVADTQIEDGAVHVTLAFQSDQIRVTRNEAGDVVDGDPNRIDLVKDRWTFSRPLNSRDPNWTLTATGGGEEV